MGGGTKSYFGSARGAVLREKLAAELEITSVCCRD
jgi:hypothetical protein